MLNRDVLGWLDRREAGRPYFVFVNYYDAHSPFLPPDGPAERFGLGALPLAERLEIDRRYLELKSGKLPLNNVSPEQIQNQAIDLYRDSYESCVAYLDHQVGRLLDTLERRGALDNTLVIVTSDHGEHFGEHGLLGHGLSLYRREVHVPLVIIPPSRGPSASRVNEPVSLRDVPATVAEWVEPGARNPFPGRPLTRFAGVAREEGGDPAPVLCEVQRIEVFGQSPQIPSSLGPVRSVVSWERVYIRGHDGREELFDLTADPLEASNLAGTPGSSLIVERLRDELARIDRDAAGPNPDPQSVPNPPDRGTPLEAKQTRPATVRVTAERM
jgi:arylsulfatase A-like enzyme